MNNLVKTYSNTKKGRTSIPSTPGAYTLKDQKGNPKYQGMTKNLNRRIKEHHYDKSKHFAKASVTPTKSKSQAKRIEKKRLSNRKPAYNKKK